MSVDQVRAAVAELSRELAGRGAEIEQAGRIPADVVRRLHRAGVFRLWVPVELGGYEAQPAEVVELIRTLAAADGATGWCAATGVASNIAGAVLAEPVARKVYAEPDTLCGGALAPGGRAAAQADGGFVVDGRWSFGSGTQHCDWVIGAAVVTAGGAGGGQPGQPPSLRAVVMPAVEVTFHDNWNAVGLRATASVDYSVAGLYVPAERAIDLAATKPWPAGAMWRIPLRSLLYPVLGAVPLGLADRAIAELIGLAGRVRFGSPSRLADRETVQAAVGRAGALVAAGAAQLSSALQALRVAADAGDEPSPQLRAGARSAAVLATELATEAITLCYQTAGTPAVDLSHPLQRCLRDAYTAGQHYALSAQGFAIAGQVKLGFDPDPML
ncbi:MAG TPA: acyl-CoA dehydrogenase family protein [Jatrophihabitans sp.]|nr:acyl-CoA dehydrogenase family protein [Jatrophihabitans sp.]